MKILGIGIPITYLVQAVSNFVSKAYFFVNFL